MTDVWQPIETAPRDGTVITLTNAERNEVYWMQWNAINSVWVCPYGRFTWIDGGPTHWRTLEAELRYLDTEKRKKLH